MATRSDEVAVDERLRRLAALKPAAPVLSLYLDLNPTEFATHRAPAEVLALRHHRDALAQHGRIAAVLRF